MMQGFESATADWPRAQVHVEYFTPKAEPAARKGGFTVELARSGQEFFIPEGQSISEILLDHGVDVDYSCELGIRGACEQRVISGVPEHHDAILTEEVLAENKRVMICCAGCKTERLVLDLLEKNVPGLTRDIFELQSLETVPGQARDTRTSLIQQRNRPL